MKSKRPIVCEHNEPSGTSPNKKMTKNTKLVFSQGKDAALTNRKGKETSEKAEEISYVGKGVMWSMGENHTIGR
jgi:hypothetical protein